MISVLFLQNKQGILICLKSSEIVETDPSFHLTKKTMKTHIFPLQGDKQCKQAPFLYSSTI